MKRRLLSVILTAALVLTVTGCGNTQTVSVSENTEVSKEASADKTEASVESTETSTEASTETSVEASTDKQEVNVPLYKFTDRNKFIESTAASEFAKNFRLGWNLGNTFDAYNGSNGLAYETYWQKAKTTPELMQALKDAGFNTIRIPVSWHNHVDSTNTIDAEWMARVKEVVDYCIDRDMYVILNTHHDISKFFIYPSNEYRDQSNKYLKDVWTQVSEVFKDYDEHLLFESMNETRLVGTDVEWWLNPGSAECKEAVDCINDFNQTFVDVVRKSGGNNEGRFLVIPGYCTSPDGITNGGFVIPTDSTNEDPHLILAIHSYAPYSFALEMPGTKDFSSKKSADTKGVEDMMFSVYAKYVKNGIPVIIDEFGALDKGNLDARVDHAGYFVGLARSFGMCCVWWDNHNLTNSGEKFTIIDRKTMQFTFPEIVERMNAVLDEFE